MARQLSANEVINRTAISVGLGSIPNAVGSNRDDGVQLTELLNVAGQELVELQPWEVLQGTITINTAADDTGAYPLPSDYCYMIDRSGWDHTNSIPVYGPLSPQDQAYLEGRDLITDSIYSAFYLKGGQLNLFPQPPASGLNLQFKYVKRNWLQEQNDGPYRDEIGSGTDVVLYEPIMIVNYLKVKWLEAKGLDSSSARMEFELMFMSRQGKDEGARVLSASGAGRGMPYITPLRNTADSWPGLVG